MPSLESFELPPRKTLADFLNQEPASSTGKNTVFAKVEKVPRKGMSSSLFRLYSLVDKCLQPDRQLSTGVTSALRKQFFKLHYAYFVELRTLDVSGVCLNKDQFESQRLIVRSRLPSVYNVGKSWSEEEHLGNSRSSSSR